MRWFKHLTSSWDDEKLAAVVAEHGLEIYGFWWRLLEIIGKQMTKERESCCTYSPKVWAKFCGIYPKKFKKFCILLEKENLIILKNSDSSITISIPNMLKYRDEFTSRKN